MGKDYITETYNVFNLETRKFEETTFRKPVEKPNTVKLFRSIHPFGRRKGKTTKTHKKQ